MPEYINFFVVLFIVLDPIGVAWLFSAMTRHNSPSQKRSMVIRGVLLSAVILYLFFFAGNSLLGWMGITLPAFRIAGGILLFLLSLEMVFARQSGLRSTTRGEQDEAQQKDDVSVFPLAFPLLAGPGALTTIILMTAQVHTVNDRLIYSAVIFVACLTTLLILLTTQRIVDLLGQTGSNVVNRLLGLLLSALAVQFVLDGIHQSFK